MATANLQSRISLDATAFQAGLRAAGANAKKFTQSVATNVTNVGKRILSLTAGVTGLGAAIGGIAGSVSVFRTLGEAIKQAANIETLTTSFEVLLQSGEKAVAMLKELEDFANATPFKMENLAQGAKTLLSFGIASEDILPLLRQLGDVSQGNAQNFQSLTLAFGQMSSAGRLMGQDLLQMINVGFNPLQEISKRTGENMAVLKDRMSKGAVSIEEVRQAFTDATSEGGQFFDMMQKQSQTTLGLISTLRGSWDLLLQKLGTPVTNAIKPALDILIARLSDAQDAAAKIGERLGEGLSLVLEAWQSNQITDLIAKGFRLGFVKGLQGIHGVLVEVISEAIAQTFIPRYGKSTGNEWDPIAGTGDFLNVGNAQAEFDQVIDSLKKSREQREKTTQAEESRQKEIEAGREWARKDAQSQAEQSDNLQKAQKQQENSWLNSAKVGDLLQQGLGKGLLAGLSALGDLSQKIEGAGDIFEDAAQSAGNKINQGGDQASQNVKDAGVKSGQGITEGGMQQKLAQFRAAQAIAAAADMAAKNIANSGRSPEEFAKAQRSAQTAMLDPNLVQKEFQALQKIATDIIARDFQQGRASDLQALIEREGGFTQKVLDRLRPIYHDMIGFDPNKPAQKPIVDPSPNWQKMIADATGALYEPRDQMGPTINMQDQYGRQQYEQQRQTNQITKRNQQELQSLNNRLQGLGLIGA